MCWDPGRHGEGPLPQTLLWTLPLCPFYLFWRFLPVKPQLTCCLCGPCVCFCPHMTLSSFLGHSHAPSFVSLLQCYKKCCTGHLGPLLSFLRGFCLVPSNASTGHVLTDRQTETCLLVGTGWKTEPTVSVQLPHHYPIEPRSQGLLASSVTTRDRY